MAVSGQIRNKDAQILFGEAACEEGHDCFVRGKPGKEHDGSLRRSASFVEDGDFHSATAGRKEISFFLIGFRKRQPEACGDKNNSG